jgi:hypothetical protein
MKCITFTHQISEVKFSNFRASFLLNSSSCADSLHWFTVAHKPSICVPFLTEGCVSLTYTVNEISHAPLQLSGGLSVKGNKLLTVETCHYSRVRLSSVRTLLCKYTWHRYALCIIKILACIADWSTSVDSHIIMRSVVDSRSCSMSSRIPGEVN